MKYLLILAAVIGFMQINSLAAAVVLCLIPGSIIVPKLISKK